MKHMRFTNAHQSLAFSRRMMLLGAAQGVIGAALIGRMGWLAIAQNQKYQLLSESNRVQLIPVPPRRGWIIDRKGRVAARVLAEVTKGTLNGLIDDELARS